MWVSWTSSPVSSHATAALVSFLYTAPKRVEKRNFSSWPACKTIAPSVITLVFWFCIVRDKKNPSVSAATRKGCKEEHHWPTETRILLAGREKWKSGNIHTWNNVYAVFHFRIWVADNYQLQLTIDWLVLETLILPVIIVYNLHLQALNSHMSFFFSQDF